MKLLIFLVTLLTSPFINALVTDNDNGAQGMLNSYLESPKIDSRSASAARGLGHEAIEERASPHIKAVDSKAYATELSKRVPDICIDFCCSPDNVQDGACYTNNCTQPGECMNINDPLPGGMKSIHFGDGIVCDVFRAYNCKVDGRNSHSQIRRGMSDLTGLLQGLAHSYSCQLANGSGKRTIESVESRTNSPISNSKPNSRDQLGACIDHCSGEQFTGSCTRNHCTGYTQCTNVPKKQGGILSVGFRGATRCTLYTMPDCAVNLDNSYVTVGVTSNDVRYVPGWNITGNWPAPVLSFRYGRPNKRGIGTRAKVVAKREATSISKRGDLTRRVLGTCVDYCSGRDFKGKCTRNKCTNADECVYVADGIQSIGFAGAIRYAIYTSGNCVQWGGNGKVIITKTTTYVEAWVHWATPGMSFMCERPYKRSLKSIDSKPAAVAAPEVEKRAGLGACADYCSGPNFTGKCTRNHCMWPNE